MSDQTRFQLSESDLPKSWYNLNADSPVPPTPVLHPGTMEPVTPDFLSVLFPMELILIIVVVLLLFGGGGYWGRRRGHW